MNYQRGMTLIEVLVALTLMALLSVGMFATFSSGQRTYMQVVRIESTAIEVVSTHRLLRRIIESSYPFVTDSIPVRFGLEGTVEDLNITAAAPGSSGLGFYRYHVFLQQRQDGLKDLAIEYGIDRDGLMLTNQVGKAVGMYREILLAGVKSMDIKYLSEPKTVNGNPTQLASEEIWISRWQQSRLPMLVQMVVHFPAGDARHWPVLVAAPVINANVNCEFDVVAQSCREESL